VKRRSAFSFPAAVPHSPVSRYVLPFALRIALCLAVLGAALLAGCNITPGGGTDVGNPDVTSRVSGSLLHANGTPAQWIKIQLRPKTFLSNPDSLPALTGNAIQDEITDTQGFFTFDSVPKGDYRIQAFDTASHGATMDFSADGHTLRMTLATATLDTTGAITGKVAYHGPAKAPFPKVYVSVFGTERWTIANDSGDYTLSDLPPGKYSLRLTTPANTALSATVPDISLTAGGNASAGTVDLGP